MSRRLCAGLIAGVLAALLALAALSAGPAAADAAPCFDKVAPLPGVIPPWGFHTGDPLTSNRGSYARAYGNIDLDANTISGKICQVDFRHAMEEEIVMTPLSPIIFHTHYAVLYGSPGNLIKVHVRVTQSLDASCRVGTIGVMTMYGSYNNVRKDSIRFTFGRRCASHDHLYGPGPEVNAQVPPL